MLDGKGEGRRKEDRRKENRRRINKKEKVRTGNIHDDFYRMAMDNIELAKEFLLKYLEENVVEKMDLTTLKKLENKFVSKKGQKYFTDSLYQLDYDKTKIGQLYILVEHKSYRENGVAFQLLEYIAQIYKRNKKREKKGAKVSVVIPIVIYHGVKEWTEEQNLISHINIDLERNQELIKYVPNFSYELFDVNKMKIPKDSLSEELASFMLTLGIRKNNDVLEDALRLAFRTGNKEWFDRVLIYILDGVKNIDKEKVDGVVKKLRGEGIMTIAQSFRQEGRQEGRLEGKQQEKELTAENMLKLGLGMEVIESVTSLSKEKILEIKKRISN